MAAPDLVPKLDAAGRVMQVQEAAWQKMPVAALGHHLAFGFSDGGAVLPQR